jgi:tetratricopeptide (TPR) repeat protein
MKITDFIRAKGKIVVCLFLVIMTLAVYWQVKDHAFILLDDNIYITDSVIVKKGFTAKNIACVFTACAPSEGINPWHPLTWLSFMLDYKLYGLNPSGYHITNVVLHILNTLLLFLILSRMTHTVWRSAFVSALFALHPLHVESVAWAAERKDVLSTFFGMLTIGAYLFYAQRSDVRRYAAVCMLFALSLMAKPMLVTMPFILLLLDYWPLQRFQFNAPAAAEKGLAPSGQTEQGRKKKARQPASRHSIANETAVVSSTLISRLRPLVWEKAPLFVLAIFAAALNLYSQSRIGAVDTSIPFFMRIENAAVSYVAYIIKMIWPVNLAILYPYPETIPFWKFVAALTFLTAVTVFAFRFARRLPWLFVGWCLYLGTLVPVIGIVQAGRQALADRYTYFPLIGLFLIVTWGAAHLARNLRHRAALLGAAAGIAVILSAAVAWHQTAFWKNGISLFEHTLAVTSGNAVIERCLADTLISAGRIDEAVPHYGEAVRLAPGDSETWNNFGDALRKQGKAGEALDSFRKAVQLNPDNVKALANLGALTALQGRLEEAGEYFDKALRIRPDDLEAGIGRAEVLKAAGRSAEAFALYEKMLKTNGNVPEVNYNAGTLLATSGRIDEAMRYFERAVALKPGYAKAHNNLGNVLMLKGRLDEAIAHFQTAVRIEPGFEQARVNLKGALLVKKDREAKFRR